VSRIVADWASRTWLITGASGGFGRAIAREVLKRGGRVIATARHIDGLTELTELGGPRALALKMDVTVAEDIEAMTTRARSFGGIDVLVNNAGYGFIGSVEEATEAEVRDLFEVNFFAPAALIRAVLPQMRGRGAGWVVNLSSMAGISGGPATGYYSAAKFALEGLSEALAHEVAPLGIRVLIVEPGMFRTDFFGRSIHHARAQIPDYAGVGAIRQVAVANDGRQSGDPARAATVIVDTLSQKDPPLRLLLGEGAVPAALEVFKARAQEAAAQHDVAQSTCFPAGLGLGH
jgi:NAD(P)-dependent dehydrogenase (short-subunit alcohol dehydrogenase family)